MINYRPLNKDDSIFFNNLIDNEGDNYNDFLKMGWNKEQITNHLNKNTNLSFGAFCNQNLVSFILGDFFNIEKISEYEILLLYVCKHFRKKGLGTKLINNIKENKKCLKKIYLEVSKNNLEGISFYTKMNFKTINIRKDYFFYKNNRIDSLVMNKIYKK